MKSCLFAPSPNTDNENFPYLDLAIPVATQSENAVSLSAGGSGWYLEVSNHIILENPIENKTIMEIKHWPE